MIYILLMYADTDQHGLYFLKCAEDLKAFLNKQYQKFCIEELHGTQLNDVFLQSIIEKYQSQKFIAVSYSHGNEFILAGHNNADYIIYGESTHLFKDSIFYTDACYSGKYIGQDMIKHGCLGFIGYKEAIYSSLHFDEFYQCDNYGIKQFIEGKKLIEAFQSMKKNYSDKIDKLYHSNLIVASLLRQSRDALIMLGNGDMVIEHFDRK